MSVDREKLQASLKPWGEITQALTMALGITDNKGVRCVLGTLRARGKQLEAVVDALEKRESTQGDDLEIERAADTLKWLKDTDWLLKDLGKEIEDFAGMGDSYQAIMGKLIASVGAAAA